MQSFGMCGRLFVTPDAGQDVPPRRANFGAASHLYFLVS